MKMIPMKTVTVVQVLPAATTLYSAIRKVIANTFYLGNDLIG